MFDSMVAGPPDTATDTDWFDPAWFDPAWFEHIADPAEIPDTAEIGQIPAAQSAPSGWLALELDQVTTDPARLSDADLIDTIVGFDRVASWAAARQSALLAEFARRRPVDSGSIRRETPSQGSAYAADEVGLALRLSRPAAGDRLTMAQVLAADLPATAAAWERGTIDTMRARAIVETSYLLPPEQRGALEARVLPRAGDQPVARLRASLRRAVLALDPADAQERFEHQRGQRRVVLTPEDDGMASLWALLSASDATAAYYRLSDLARSLGATDPRGMDARRADLLVDLLTGRDQPTPSPAPAQQDSTTTTPPPRPGKPSVSVIVPITMLLGLNEHPGELVGYGPIPAPLAREIAAEGTWRRLLTDPATGTLLDYGRATYTPPAGLADFVRARDVYCRRPGCGHRATAADLDHTVPWPEGTTSEHNLYAGCRHDHLIKTFAPGWNVEQFPAGRITWTTPTGHSYASHPHDYREHTPPPSTPPPGGVPPGDPPPDDSPPF